mmetsp:Transcript_8403/g.25203  ORF Transcript_8403/g.25203 Transcript_8403/m.25203 type:complete len:210 (-) Transcript_8403:1107-1736(-)
MAQVEVHPASPDGHQHAPGICNRGVPPVVVLALKVVLLLLVHRPIPPLAQPRQAQLRHHRPLLPLNPHGLVVHVLLVLQLELLEALDVLDLAEVPPEPLNAVLDQNLQILLLHELEELQNRGVQHVVPLAVRQEGLHDRREGVAACDLVVVKLVLEAHAGPDQPEGGKDHHLLGPLHQPGDLVHQLVPQHEVLDPHGVHMDAEAQEVQH